MPVVVFITGMVVAHTVGKYLGVIGSSLYVAKAVDAGELVEKEETK